MPSSTRSRATHEQPHNGRLPFGWLLRSPTWPLHYTWSGRRSDRWRRRLRIAWLRWFRGIQLNAASPTTSWFLDPRKVSHGRDVHDQRVHRSWKHTSTRTLLEYRDDARYSCADVFYFTVCYSAQLHHWKCNHRMSVWVWLNVNTSFESSPASFVSWLHCLSNNVDPFLKSHTNFASYPFGWQRVWELSPISGMFTSSDRTSQRPHQWIEANA